MSPTHDQSRSNTLPPDGPCFLQTFAEVPPRDDEAVDSSWNNGLVEYADSDSDTDETSQSPLEHSEDRTATDLDKDSKIAALLKQMDELKKERNSLDEKLRQQQADWENRLYLKELKVKSLESKLAQTPASGPLNGLTAGSDTSKRVASLEAQVTKLQSTLTVKENETHKLESKLQRCRNEARDQERRLTKELDEQNVQYKLLKTEASNARHDLKHKSQKYLELQDDYSKLKKSFAEFRDQHRGSSRERHGESSRRRSDSRHRSSSSEAHNSIGVQTEADWTEYISGEMKEALNTVLQKMERETQQRIRQLEADLASANNKNEVVTREKTQLAIQLVELQEKSQFLREADRLSTLKDEKLAKLQAELDTLTLRFGQAKQEAAEEQQKLKDQVLELQQTVDKAKEAENSDIIEVNPMEELKKLRAKHEKLRQKMEQSEKNRQALVNEILQLKEGMKITANNHLLELRKIRADRDRQLQLVNHFTASATKQTEEITNLKKELKDSKDEYSKLEQTHQIVVHTMRMETESQETGLKDRVEELSEQVVNLENTVKAKDACILALTSNTKKYQEFLQQWTERVRSKAQRLRGRQCVNCRETAIAKGEDNQSTSQASQPHAEASETPTQSSPVPSPSAESSESQPDEGLAQRGATEQPPTKKSKLFAAI